MDAGGDRDAGGSEEGGTARDADRRTDAAADAAANATRIADAEGEAAQEDARPDARPVLPGCTDSTEVIYLLSSDEELLTFDPVTVSTSSVRDVACGEDLNSMAVSRSGKFYVSSTSGSLYQFDVSSGRCTATGFDTGQLWGQKYGMGWVSDDTESGQSLYIAEERDFAEVARLSAIDPSTLELRVVGRFEPPITPTELLETEDGRVVGLSVNVDEAGSMRLIELDRRTAAVTRSTDLGPGGDVTAFDFIEWRGALYLFLSFGDDRMHIPEYRMVQRWTKGTLETLGTIEPTVIGASVSPCTPP
jgi:hypothetical protein